MPNTKKEERLLKLAREQFEAAESADSWAKNEEQEDLKIYEGEGIWDEALKASRLNDPKGARPCLTVSDLPPRVRQVTNDVRQNKPAIKIRPSDSGGDVQVAEVLNGIWRHIEAQSMSDIAYETANFYQTVGGRGYFRLVEEYYPPTRSKELLVRPIANPGAVFFDPLSLCPVGSDARYCFIVEDMPKKDFEKEYGDVDIAEWEGGEGYEELVTQGWLTEETVRVAEWMCVQEEVLKTVTDEYGEQAQYSEEEYEGLALKSVVMDVHTERRLKVVWRKITGNKILKEVELPITFVPVFRVPGEMFLKEGKIVYKGVVRDSRDAVRMVSYSFSSYIESITVQTKTPYIGAAGQFDGYETNWQTSNIENAPYLEYNPVSLDGSSALAAPRREPPPMASQGIIQGIVLSQQALKDVTGMGAASLGQKGNETSGKAILARQKEGDVGVYHYADNLSKAIRHMGTVGLQWIPKVYEERKVLRILGDDDTAKMVHMDSEQPMPVRDVNYIDDQGAVKIRKIYNIGVGAYDVVTTVGPSYSTRRQEAQIMLGELFQSAPGLLPILGDIYMETQDVPGAARMAKRLKAALPPQVAAADEDDEDTPKIPPQVLAEIEGMKQQLQEGASIVQELQAENEKLTTELSNKQSEVDAKLAAVNAGIEEEKIRSLAQVTIAEMNNESREKIAGLQSEIEDMKQTMTVFMQVLKGAGASEPETPKEPEENE